MDSAIKCIAIGRPCSVDEVHAGLWNSVRGQLKKFDGFYLFAEIDSH